MWNSVAGCKDIAERDAIAEHIIHKTKLSNIKSRIDNKPPRVMPHVRRKAKKELEEQKSQAEIQHQNQLLLKKLEKIEHNSSRAFSFCKNRSGYLNKMRIDEMLRITEQNNKILDRIQSTKPHYSASKQQQDYLFKKYLSIQLSENARRIPRVSSYNVGEMNDMIKLGKYFRPNTASDMYKPLSKSARPGSAKHIKEDL
ncbi:hypothetical protein SteCoe_4014 [Stentor coeruleus]|uniref:Uncharacterized protein n=1 Tax=Stentor coeruleus TaxID=5963 RepID=A0A1R2CVR6_9CILI|nr:hypothetical protein SteCoe_17936 [Stentor coeruleus]OMJ93073.1 hypothetical protein SteCoe_4014 [Stentor coeruleus]